MSLRLDWCSYEAAKYAVEHWHYSKSVPAAPVNIGVWENDKFIGAILFARGANPRLWMAFEEYGINNPNQICELVRIALDKHSAPVSKIVTISIKMIKKQSPGIRLIISYADTRQNHIGGIYQAMNWIYSGKIKGTPQWFYGGKWIHQRQLGSLLRNINGGKVKGLRGVIPIREASDKYRYLYPLDNEMKKQIEPLRQPYPKRGRGEIDNAPQSNEETGGASPTRPLLDFHNMEAENG